MNIVLKRILIFLTIIIFCCLYAVGIIYAFRGGDNALSIMIVCFATIGVLSVLIGFVLRLTKYINEQK